MDWFSNFFKDPDKGGKKLFSNLLFIFGIGVLLILFGNSLFGGIGGTQKDLIPPTNMTASDTTKLQESHESNMEKRLQDILSRIEGVGKVEVMLTISYGKEIVLAEDTKVSESSTQERAQDGGTRDIQSKDMEDKTVMYTRNGSTEPVVLKEKQPKVEGVIIIAEGGGDVLIQAQLSQAAQILMDVPAHKVQIFKMNTKK